MHFAVPPAFMQFKLLSLRNTRIVYSRSDFTLTCIVNTLGYMGSILSRYVREANMILGNRDTTVCEKQYMIPLSSGCSFKM